MSQVSKANLQAFMKAAVARAKTLKASADDHTHDVGVVLASAAGAISAYAQTSPVDPNDLSRVFEGAGVARTFSDCLIEAQAEIRAICLKLE